MSAKHSEAAFETAIEIALLARGFTKGDPKTYNATLGLFPADVIAYIKAANAKKWQSLTDLQGSAAEATRVLNRLFDPASPVGPARRSWRCSSTTYRFRPSSWAPA